MKNIKKGIVIFLITLIPVSIGLQSCQKVVDILNIVDQVLSLTGWLFNDENMDNIPEDITPFDDDDSVPLRDAVSLESKFPPIGDQGSYGTCVAWSVGYNLKTSLNAIEKGWNTTDLNNSENQASPYDLWKSINKANKAGSGCNGTNFEPALDAIISNGVASLNSVPYTKTLNCSDKNPAGSSANKLANYRKIASETQGLTVDNFKGYLNAGRPIAIGAKLGERFMGWNSSNVLSDDTDTYKGQHAYHAMALVGYDDNKQAFRVRNSWGGSWGDNGSIWVDYDFFCKQFCFAAFVAQNPTASLGSSGTTGVSGPDLLAFYVEDYPSTDPDDIAEGRNRTFSYDVYNAGTTTISPSQKWTITYMYYNAKNAKQYEIIYDDYFTDEDPDILPGEYMYNENSTSIAKGYWNNITISSGENYGFDDEIAYMMPKITGEYYLVVMADAFDVISEVNEDNNFYFITAANGKPLNFVNGATQDMPPKKTSLQRTSSSVKRPAQFSNTETQTTVVEGNMNAYTPAEIKAMLLHDKKSGKLDAKRKAFHVENSEGELSVKRARK